MICNTRVTGKDLIKSFSNVDSLADCKLKCKSTSSCMSYDWQFTNDDEVCKLYSNKKVLTDKLGNVHYDIRCELPEESISRLETENERLRNSISQLQYYPQYSRSYYPQYSRSYYPQSLLYYNRSGHIRDGYGRHGRRKRHDRHRRER